MEPPAGLEPAIPGLEDYHWMYFVQSVYDLSGFTVYFNNFYFSAFTGQIQIKVLTSLSFLISLITNRKGG